MFTSALIATVVAAAEMYSSPGLTPRSTPLTTVSRVHSSARVGDPVRLSGRLVRWDGKDQFVFRDPTGTIVVDAYDVSPAQRRAVPADRDFVLIGEVDVDRRGRREVDFIRIEAPGRNAPPSAPAATAQPARTRFAATTVARILAEPVYDQRVEFRARIESWIDDNDYMASDGGRRIRLDGGPAWHHQLDLSPGENVVVRGEVDFNRRGEVEVDIWEIVRGNGAVVRLRGEGPPPWAGGPRRNERRSSPPVP